MLVKLGKKTYQTQIPVAIGTGCVTNIYRIKTRSNKPAFIEVTNSCNGFHPEIMKVVQLLKKIPRRLCSPEVHCRFCSAPPLVSAIKR